MELNPPSTPPQPDKPAPSPQQSQPEVATTPPRKPIPKKTLLIIGGVVLLIIFIVLGIFLGGSSSNKAPQTKDTTNDVTPTDALEKIKKSSNATPNAKAASHLLVFGTWTGQTSTIKAVDLTNSNNLVLATLPLEIKKVNILTDKTLLYIDQTDIQDHGKQVTLYNMKDKTISASIPAAAGYSIDDYVLSPNKKYIAVWEVSFAPGTKVLQGGQSRVYSIDLSRPSIKNLLYDETINTTIPVHYPRAILNNGTVFTDTFMANDPNGGAGWAYGMSVVDFGGTNKKDIDNMKPGTYSTQPTLSQDGKYLLFAGYDGAKGDGNAVVNGYRRALLSPNTVDLLDTQTLQRFKLPNVDNKNTYPGVSWDIISGNVTITSLSKDVKKTGLFSYNLSGKSMTEIVFPNSEEAYGYVSQLPGEKLLMATSDNTTSHLGNLGDNYAYPLTRLSLMDEKDAVSNLTVQDPFMQYITILPGTYFKSVLGTKTIAQGINVQPTIIDLYSDNNDQKQNLQLYTFFLKTDLSSTRLKQQSDPIVTPPVTPGVNLPIGSSIVLPSDDSPKCEDLAEKQCTEQGVAISDTKAYDKCVKTNKDSNKMAAIHDGRCHDSPLYLYGTSGKKIHVQIHTRVSDAVPAYNNGYDVVLGNRGEMLIDGKSYHGLAYNYTSNLRRLTPPKAGVITTRRDAEKVLSNYAAEFGLNAKETADLIQSGKQKITSPYAFVSFFNHETSQQILPITFDPQPDNYLNVVFYFKLLETKPTFTPNPPNFPTPLNRTGFTAVEVSEIVE